jgi:coiled-coil domain-containing protein 63/114
MEKTKGKGMAAAQEQTATPVGEFSNPVALLKLRLQKWTTNNKEKKNLMDMYIRNVHIIEDAFAQIIQQTGISSTEEIVTTFIKAEEQNYSLYNYVNTLNSEIDMIEEQNKKIAEDIANHEKLGDMNEKEKEECRQMLKDELAESEQLMVEKDEQIKTIEGQMVSIKKNVQNMCENFKSSRFFLSVAQNMQYDDDTTFNESNVTFFLAELEEYISLFITYLAYKNENPDAAIASLSLDTMKAKEFDKNALHVDPKNSNEVNVAEDLETEDEITVDPKKLYKMYEKMYQQEHGAE